MIVIEYIILPCFLLGIGFFFAIRGAFRTSSPTRMLFLCPLIFSLIVTIGFMIREYNIITTSKSSTAAIGFIFLPFYSVVVAVTVLLVSWSCLYVARFVIERILGISDRITSIGPLIVAIVLLVQIGYFVQYKVTRDGLLETAATGNNADSLSTILAESSSSRDLEVLSKLAKNPKTPSSSLTNLYYYCKPSLEKFNPPEYSVLMSLAQNPKTPPDILAALATCRQSSIRYAVAINPSTPTNTLLLLEDDQDLLVRKYAKSKLCSRGNDSQSQKERPDGSTLLNISNALHKRLIVNN